MGTEKPDRQSDREIIDSLYRRYAADIRRFIGRYSLPFDEAQDLVQDVFIRCYTHMDNSRPEAYRAFLYRIARNLVIDRFRRIQREQKWIAGQQVLSFASSAELAPRLTADATDLERALAKLPERLRGVFILRELEGCTLEEIGEIHGMSISTTKRNLEVARRDLRSLLAETDRKPNVKS